MTEPITESELSLRLRKMNRAGTIMTIFSDGGETLQVMPDSFIPLRVEGNHFWLLWKSTGYLEDPELCRTIKVVDHFVNTYLEDKKYGRQWLTVTMQDDQNRLYLIEIIEPFCEPKAYKKWRKWRRYRQENKETFKKVDAELLAQHQKIAASWDD